jgi:hypothetical protein
MISSAAMGDSCHIYSLSPLPVADLVLGAGYSKCEVKTDAVTPQVEISAATLELKTDVADLKLETSVASL